MNTGRKATNGNPRRREPQRPTGPLICPLYGHDLPQENGKPKVKLVDGEWMRFCKECEWVQSSSQQVPA